MTNKELDTLKRSKSKALLSLRKKRKQIEHLKLVLACLEAKSWDQVRELHSIKIACRPLRLAILDNLLLTSEEEAINKAVVTIRIQKGLITTLEKESGKFINWKNLWKQK